MRSSHKGESHGGAYIIDLETGDFEQVIDYTDSSIDWEGRGGNRGFRGIAFYRDEVYLAASNEIFVYSKDLGFVRSIQNGYLKHCHEIYVSDDTLYITATGFDSVLEYDLQTHSFTKGYCLRFSGLTRRRNMLGYREKIGFIPVPRVGFSPLPRLWVFDPNSDEGPEESNTCHLNNVFRENGPLFVSGTRCAHLMTIDGSGLSGYSRLPYGTHNARPFKNGVLMNDTRHDRVSYLDHRGENHSFPIKRHDERELLNSNLPKGNARQAFGRGLCILGEGLIAGGSSPAAVSAYDLNTSSVLTTINLSMDMRKTIHGLEVWPF